MQYVEGHSLSQLLRERGPMPPEQVMSVVEQVADGLQAASCTQVMPSRRSWLQPLDGAEVMGPGTAKTARP